MNIYFKYSKRLLQMFVATRYATQIRSSSNVCRYSICDLEKVEFKCFEVLFERTEPLFGVRRRNGNMCPITEKYMKNEYLDSVANIPVRVDGRLEKELKDKAGKVLALQRKGAKLIFPDVLSIEQELLQ